MRAALLSALCAFATLLSFEVNASSTKLIEKCETRIRVDMKDGARYGTWYTYQSTFAPFPHNSIPLTHKGPVNTRGEILSPTAFQDDRIAVFVPDSFQGRAHETVGFVYFHGVDNTVDNVRCNNERYQLGEKSLRQEVPVVVIVPQGPHNVWSNFWGKMRDQDGLKNLLVDLVGKLNARFNTNMSSFQRLFVCGHSGGFEGAAMAARFSGVPIDAIFLSDALYAYESYLRDWLVINPPVFIYGAYTKHLKKRYQKLERSARRHGVATHRIQFSASEVIHTQVDQRYLEEWLKEALKRTGNKPLASVQPKTTE